MDETFAELHKKSKQLCSCGSKDLVAPIFHADECPYLPIAKTAFPDWEDLPGKESEQNGNVQESGRTSV